MFRRIISSYGSADKNGFSSPNFSGLSFFAERKLFSAILRKISGKIVKIN